MKTQLLKLFFLSILGLTSLVSFSQGTVTGKIIDSETKEVLTGASVVKAGTTTGTTTDVDGAFKLNLPAGSNTIQVSFIGYETYQKKVQVVDGQTTDLGNVAVTASAIAINELVVIGKGVIDLDQDRKTPIAVSTITIQEIQSKSVGNVEFPELMKNTPSVYVSNQSGGFGDSQMFLRGFDQRNTAFLLNGQPINGMEDGKMYWSNWAGLSDIANAVQIQRGLGSSKLAISSVGGTINIVTKATDLKEGGFVRLMTGNDDYVKGTASYSTGINEKGWGFSVMLDYWQGYRKWAAGTKGEGQNYFFSIGKIAGDHKFNFLLVGAPQWHGQNYTKSQALYDQYGIKYNNNYGYLNGEFYTSRKNYYHKPVLNFNWDWDINEKSNLSTVLYASFGRGGGTGTLGNGPGYITNGYTSDGLINWDEIKNVYNPTITDGISSGYNGTLMRSSVNNHAWYGMVTNYEYDTQKNFTFNVGADVRFYQGDHFRQLVDLLGLKGRQETMMGQSRILRATFDANPWASLFNYADESERLGYDYSENLNYQGVFGQAEYAVDDFSAFVQASVSNQSYKREDRTNFSEVKTSDTVNKQGYNIKGGASYTIAEHHKIFANAGVYSRQPFLDNVFPDYDDYTREADPSVDNEKITGLEGGYSFSTTGFTANLNGYYTTWKNRFYDTFGSDAATGVSTRTIYTDIAEIHKGLELDVRYKPIATWMLRGYTTYGDWKYDGSTPFRTIDSDSNAILDQGNADLTGTKIGSAPQVTAGLGTSYDLIQNKLSVDLDFNHYAQFYGYVDQTEAIEAPGEYQPEKLNSYSLVDLGISYKIAMGDNNLIIRGNVYNLFDKEYVSQQDSYGILYGAGTTWNFSVKYSF